jgi:small subunit ribosomal protein S12
MCRVTAMANLVQIAKKKTRKKRREKKKKIALANSPQKRGTCIKVHIITPKKPCSARRAIARVKLSNGNVVTCHIPGERHNLKRFSTVLVRGGRPNDLPAVKYRIIRGARRTDLHPVYRRRSSRSKYGVKNPWRLHKIRSTRGQGQKIYYNFG